MENRFQGHTDVSLDDVGREQARQAARILAALRPEAIVTSDLSRARDTALALSDLVRLPVEVEAGLRETNGGEWEGRTVAEITSSYETVYAQWRRGEDVHPPGGESRTQVADRAIAVFERQVKTLGDGGTLVMVSHGGTVRVLLGRLLGLPVANWPALGGLSNCCWSVLGEADSDGLGRWRLLEHNAGSLPEPVMSDDE